MALITRRPRTSPAATILPAAFAGRLVWNEKLQRYRGSNGRFIGPLVVRAEIDKEIDASEARLLRNGRRYINGDIDINDWRALAANEIKLNFLANYAAAKGGFAQLNGADYKQVERMVRRQFKYLERFAREVDANPARFTEAGFLNRLGMYSQAAREAYEEARRQGHKKNGYKYARNVPHSSESCKSNGGKRGCSELTNAGWIDIDKFIMPGRRACYTRCRCTVEYAMELPVDVLPGDNATGGDQVVTPVTPKPSRKRPAAPKIVKPPSGPTPEELAKKAAEEAVAKAEEARLAAIAAEKKRQREAAPAARKKIKEIAEATRAEKDAIEAEARRITDRLEVLNQAIDDAEAAYNKGEIDQLMFIRVVDDIDDQRGPLMARRSELYKNSFGVNIETRKRALEQVLFVEPDKRQNVAAKPVSKFDPKRKKNIEEGLEAFNNLVGVPAPDSSQLTVKAERGKRSAYYHSQRQVGASKQISARVMVHELGHWLEDSDPAIQAKAYAFYDRRTAGEPLELLRDVTGNKAYKRTEKTRRDKWKNAYVGKEYVWNGKRYGSEITSMGIEEIYANPVDFAEEDPEYFDFIYNLLRGYDASDE